MSPPRPEHPRYEIQELIGQGGMGAVYKAWDREENQTVALKTVLLGAADDRRRFETEMRTLARLRHDGVVRLHDLGSLGGEPFFTMDYLPGVSLDRFLAELPPPLEEIRWLAGVAVKVLDALAYVHGQGVLHGDLKPSNIVALRSDPSDGQPRPAEIVGDPDPRVKVLDFGLARKRHLGTGRFGAQGEGTPLYMAPEQVEGSSIDERSDLYSVGALLYHLVAREPPYPSVVEVMSRRSRPEPLSARNPACPSALSDLVLNLLSREPRDRLSSAEEAAARLIGAAGIPERAAYRVAPRLLAPAFVGRKAELDSIRSALAAAAAGEGGLLRISGERGSGKSWLVHRSGLKSEAILDFHAAFLRGSFPERGPVHNGLSEVFRGALDLLGSSEGGDGVDPPEPLGPWAGSFLETLGLGAGDAAPREIPPVRVAREQFLQTAIEILRKAASRKPLLVILEDLQHAGDLALGLLSRLPRVLPSLPALVVVTYRSEAVTSPHLSRWLREIDELGCPAALTLEGFPDRDLSEFVETVLSPKATGSMKLLSYLRERTDGYPAALHRWLRFLWEQGALVLDGDLWTLTTAPETLSATRQWKERLGELDPQAREVLVGGAVLGTSFRADLLADLIRAGERDPVSVVDVEVSLRALVAAGFLLEDADGFSLACDLEPDLLRPWLTEERERALHRRAAELSLHGPATAAHSFRAARHFAQAGDRDRAARYLLEAGRHAARTYANRRGIEALREALELTQGQPGRAEVARELGELHARVGEHREALEAFLLAEREEKARGGSPRADARRLCSLWDEIGRVLHRQGELDVAQDYFERCARASEGEPARQAKALFRLAGICFDRGNLAAARGFFNRSLELYGPESAPAALVGVYSGLGLVERQENNPQAAVDCFRRALSAAEKAGNLLEAAAILNNLGNLLRDQGETESAIDCLRRSTQSREMAGDRQGLAICLNNMARIQSQRGEFRAAEEATSRALGIFEEISDKKGVLIARCNLGEFLLNLGDFERAQAMLVDNLELAEDLGATRLQESTLRNLARIALERGDAAGAAELVRRCLKTMPLGELQALRAGALVLLAEALLELSRLEDAGDAIAEAVAGSAEAGPETLVDLCSAQIRLHLLKGELDEARVAGHRLLEDSRGPMHRFGLARLHRELGRTYRDLGPDWADRTEKHLSHALRDFEDMCCPHEVAETLAQLGLYWKLLGEESAALEHWQRSESLFLDLALPRRVDKLANLQAQA